MTSSPAVPTPTTGAADPAREWAGGSPAGRLAAWLAATAHLPQDEDVAADYDTGTACVPADIAAVLADLEGMRGAIREALPLATEIAGRQIDARASLLASTLAAAGPLLTELGITEEGNGKR